MSSQIVNSTYTRPQLGLKPTRFNFNVAMFPNTTFTVQSCTIPSVSCTSVKFDNPLQTINLPGDNLEYSPFQIRIMVDEDMLIYAEMYGWMRSHGFATLRNDTAAAVQKTQGHLQLGRNPEMPLSDVYLEVLDGQNNPRVKFTFLDAFPMYIGELKFDTTENGTTYLYCDIEFAYNYFTLDKV
jgi:hypothetical protein